MVSLPVPDGRDTAVTEYVPPLSTAHELLVPVMPAMVTESPTANR